MILMIGCGDNSEKEETADVTLRICNWEEYIDEGGWEENEVIDISDELEILGENPLWEDFEAWYFENYGINVNVEYSTFGTNEDIYNQLTLGDTFDLICPSEYMIMKLMTEDRLEPYSEDFFDKGNPYNYYSNGISPYIRQMFADHEIGGESWEKYAAGYMWGTTGIVYNPALVSKEQASTWKILNNPDFRRRVTIKDNVRDSYFAALGILKSDVLLDPSFTSSSDYEDRLAAELNDTSDEAIENTENVLKDIKDNVYSFETDSGKADMVTGKVAANYQWSGDAVYTMEQAEEDETELHYTVPMEGGNLWFDGWVMLKDGIDN
ncbi:MAG: extracellular solute-binding protein, partial [Lachnoclostridium sp.]|nr:extracellular solute-binding protein [Lachnoclostridium sp.]